MSSVKGMYEIIFRKRKGGRRRETVRLLCDYKNSWGIFWDALPKLILVIIFCSLLLYVGCVTKNGTISSVNNNVKICSDNIAELKVSIEELKREIRKMEALPTTINDKVLPKIDSLEKRILDLKGKIDRQNATTNSKICVITVPVSAKLNTTTVIYE